MTSDPSDYIKAWGVTRRAAEWVKTAQCAVDEDELRRRIRAGMKAELAITSPLLPPPREPTPLSKTPFAERPAALPKPPRKGKHSRFRGVSKRGGRWYAQIRKTPHDVTYLGEYPDEISAALAYDNAARPLGKKLNFPGKTSGDVGSR